MEETILKLDSVYKSYHSSGITTEVLKGINLSIFKGEFVSLVGPSGSGKSTMLHIMGLLEPPSSGRVAINGIDSAKLADPKLTKLRGESTGFVFQFHHLIPSFTALENVIMPLMLNHGSRKAEHDDRGLYLLEKVGLSDRAHFKPAKLSGGQQQRVAIARSLAASPPLILADEPTGNLDSGTADEIFTLMRRIAEYEGTTFLIVTHDKGLASRCDRTIEMLDGKLIP